MQKKNVSKKNDLDKVNNAWAGMRLMAVVGLLLAGVTLLGWVEIHEVASRVIGAFLVAVATTLMFLWFRYSKIKF